MDDVNHHFFRTIAVGGEPLHDFSSFDWRYERISPGSMVRMKLARGGFLVSAIQLRFPRAIASVGRMIIIIFTLFISILGWSLSVPVCAAYDILNTCIFRALPVKLSCTSEISKNLLTIPLPFHQERQPYFTKDVL